MASDLLETCLQLHMLNFDPSGSPGKSFRGRRIGPKLEKARVECCSLEALQVLFRGGLYQMFMPSEILFDTKNTLLGDGPTCSYTVIWGLGRG